MKQTGRVVFLEICTVLVVFVAFIACFVAWRLSQGPIPISFAKPRIEQALSDPKTGRKAVLGDVQIEWLREKSHFGITASEVKVLSAQDEMLAEARFARIDLDALPLLGGDLSIREVVLEEGHLDISFTNSGLLTIAGATINLRQGELPTEVPTEIADIVLSSMIEAAQNARLTNGLGEFGLEGFTASILHVDTGLTWKIEDVSLAYRTNEATTEILWDAKGANHVTPDILQLSLEVERAVGEGQLAATLGGVDLSNFENEQSKAPVDQTILRSKLDVKAKIDANLEGMQAVGLEVSASKGQLEVDDRAFSIGTTNLTASYSPETGHIDINLAPLNIGPISTDGEVHFEDGRALLNTPMDRSHPITWTFPRLEADFENLFEAPVDLEDVSLQTDIHFSEKWMRINELKAREDGVLITANGRVDAHDVAPDSNDLPFSIRLSASTNGALPKDTVLSYWPPRLGSGARNWVRDQVRNVDISNAVFEFDLKPDSFANGFLENEVLALDFSFSEGDISILHDIPNIVDANGQARLLGNNFTLDIGRGRIGSWDLTEGDVEIEYFNPKGGNILVDVRGVGDATDMMRVLSNSRLQLEAEQGFSPERVTGNGELRFRLQRPALSNVSYDDTRFIAEGRIRSGGFEGVAAGIDLTGTEARILVTNDKWETSGYGQFGPAPIEFTWIDEFRKDTTDRVKVSASGLVTPDVLNRFGLTARAYMSGEANAKLEATGPNGGNLDNVDVEFDLTGARIDASEFGWVKPFGEAADGVLNYRLEKDTHSTAIRLEGDGAVFDGEFSFVEGEGIESVHLNRAFVERQLDVSGDILRSNDGGLALTLNGPFLNADPFLGSLGGVSGGNGGLVFGDVEIDSSIDQLVLRDGFILGNARFTGAFSGGDVNALEVSGDLEGEGRFNLALDSVDEQRRLTIVSDNAGFLVKGLLGGDFVQGGDLTLTGDIAPAGKPTIYNVKLENARLAQAPLLTQVLSLASLRGLSDVLNGEGILFSEVELPLTVDENGFYFKGGRASGPALGLTANGAITDAGKGLEVDGVLVPSFGVNSALGGIPIIGDLFVSREGEGVFAVTYSVRGSLQEARVSINPLSGVVPGVLRRIFENPGSSILDDAEQANDDADE